MPPLVVATGASLTGVTLTLRLATLLVSAPSLTENEIVRASALGSSLVLR